MNLAFLSLIGIFNTFLSGTKALKETGPEMEIPGRDLDVGTKNEENYSET